MWDLLRAGIETMSPALAGGLSTAGPPGKPSTVLFFKQSLCVSLTHLPLVAYICYLTLPVLIPTVGHYGFSTRDTSLILGVSGESLQNNPGIYIYSLLRLWIRKTSIGLVFLYRTFDNLLHF